MPSRSHGWWKVSSPFSSSCRIFQGVDRDVTESDHRGQWTCVNTRVQCDCWTPKHSPGHSIICRSSGSVEEKQTRCQNTCSYLAGHWPDHDLSRLRGSSELQTICSEDQMLMLMLMMLHLETQSYEREQHSLEIKLWPLKITRTSLLEISSEHH